MCYGAERFPSTEDFDVSTPARSPNRPINDNEAAVEGLLNRLAETEARLERARAREAELSRQLEEMKRFVSVMEILETYLKRRYREQQDQLYGLYLPAAAQICRAHQQPLPPCFESMGLLAASNSLSKFTWQVYYSMSFRREIFSVAGCLVALHHSIAGSPEEFK